MSKMLICLCVALFVVEAAVAQPYIGNKSRHRFAQLNLGLDMRHYTGNGRTSFFDNGGNLRSMSLTNRSEARIIIGGTHFWGHADFQIAIPVLGISGSGFSGGVETSFKYYPVRIENNKVRFYVGRSMLPTSYKQGAGAKMIRNRYPLLVGATYNSGQHLVDLGLGYMFNNSLQYYISPQTQVQVKTPNAFVSLGYKLMLETTASAERRWNSGATARLTDTLAKLKRLNGWTIAAGPSAAFLLRKSPNADVPSLGDHSGSGVFPDLGIGYYLHKPDLHFNLAYRRYKSAIEAYGNKQITTRRSLALEGYKFIGDYHGFAPFAGVAVSYEKLSVTDKHLSSPEVTSNYTGIHPGITFGWDIRPDRLQAFYLRTNLRYFPMLNMTTSSGQQLNFDALEVNFIQLVFFPGRMF